MTEYRVVVSFAGFIGCEQEYIVTANTREEAEQLALEEAHWDLQVEEVEEDD